MKHELQIDGKDLNDWASRLPARSELPRLVYRLVHETVDTVDSISFPCSEEVQLSGWDGCVDVRTGHQYVPTGVSRWEVKVSKNITTEANKDYKKRTDDPLGAKLDETTFVFATLREWPSKTKWRDKKRKEGKWKQVEAFDAGDFAAWLNFAPATLTWLSTALGKQPRGALDLEQEWLNWSEITSPPISTELVLAGREEAVASVQNWLTGNENHLAIQADSQADALAIFSASLLALPEEDRERQLARTVVVKNRETWDQVIGSKSALTLVSALNDAGAVAQARRSGHRVFVPLGLTDSVSEGVVVARRLSRRKASDALCAMGLDSDKAWRSAALARRGLKSFQRVFAVNAGDQKPSWASGDDAVALCPLVLAGSWDDANEDDRAAVELLAGKKYAEVSQTLRKWGNDVDPPIRFVGGCWVVTSVEDAHALLHAYLSPEAISAFGDVAVEVLGTREPRFELPKEERHFAELKGHGPVFSERLKGGLAETLAIAGARWSEEEDGTGWGQTANRVVRELLGNANEDWLGWASLSDCLPLLAEAAPAEFLSAVESGLDTKEENPVLVRLFQEEGDSALFTVAPHTGLLWALETLAWSSVFLARTALLLGGLARRDPGGKIISRPTASLRGIFLPWHPLTSASLQQRLVALDLLADREPDVSWALLISLLPELESFGEIGARPKWRDWASDRREDAPTEERDQAVSEILDRLLRSAGEVGGRWADLARKVDELPSELHDLVVEKLAETDVDTMLDGCRAEVWHALRKQVSRHRSFPDAHWALPSDRVEILAELLDRFEPSDPFERYGWLFDHRPDLIEGERTDFHAHQAAVAKGQVDAVCLIASQSGMGGVAAFAAFVNQPHFVGSALGRSDLLSTTDDEDEFLTAYLASKTESEAMLAAQFGWTRTRSKGAEWCKEFVRRNSGTSWSAEQRAALLTSLPYEGATFDFVEGLGAIDESAYWNVAMPWGVEVPGDLERSTRKLLEAGRAGVACSELSFSGRRGTEMPPELIAEVLEMLLKSEPGMMPQSYDIEGLLKILVEDEGFDRGRVARLEWAFLPPGNQKPPQVLHKMLAEDPSFFAMVVCWMCGKTKEQVDENAHRGLASRAHRLIHSWRAVPGAPANEAIDSAALKEWVSRARELLGENEIARFGDQMIGQVLSGCPAGSDGAWPHEAVRDLLEDVCSADIELGLSIGLSNSRGAVFRSIEGGGDDERTLSATLQKYAETVRSGPWPRSAAMLDGMAAHYRSSARHEDVRSELEGDRD